MVSSCSGAILAAFLIAGRTAEILRPDKSGLRMTGRDLVDVILRSPAPYARVFCKSRINRAFWTCSRFSAWS
jgi:hypothetical protein